MNKLYIAAITLIVTIATLVFIANVALKEYKQYRLEEQAWQKTKLELELKARCQEASAVAGENWGYKNCLKELNLNKLEIKLN